jgi:hypothetical protein
MESFGHNRTMRKASTPAAIGATVTGLGAGATGGVGAGSDGGATTGGAATGGARGGSSIGGGIVTGGGIGDRPGTAMTAPAAVTPPRAPALARRTSAGVMLFAGRGAIAGSEGPGCRVTNSCASCPNASASDSDSLLLADCELNHARIAPISAAISSSLNALGASV